MFIDNLYTAGPLAWTMLALIILSGLAAIISLMRFGVRTFWSSDATAPRLQLTEAMPVSILLLLCIAMTVLAGPTSAYLDRTASALHEPSQYIDRVMSVTPVPGVIAVEGAEP